MTDKNHTTTEQDAASIAWNKAMQKYWLPLFKPWRDVLQPPEGEEHGQFNKGRVAKSLQVTVRMWQPIMRAMSESAALEHFKKATEVTPDIVLGFAQTCLQSFTSLQAQAGEWIQKRGLWMKSPKPSAH